MHTVFCLGYGVRDCGYPLGIVYSLPFLCTRVWQFADASLVSGAAGRGEKVPAAKAITPYSTCWVTFSFLPYLLFKEFVAKYLSRMSPPTPQLPASLQFNLSRQEFVLVENIQCFHLLIHQLDGTVLGMFLTGQQIVWTGTFKRQECLLAKCYENFLVPLFFHTRQ